MQLGSQDKKKDLPIIIALIVVILGGGGFVAWKFMGNSGDNATATAPATPPTAPVTAPATGATPPQSGAAPVTTTPTSTGATSPTGTAGTTTGTTDAGQPADAQIAQGPAEPWRPDPFAPPNYVEKKGKKRTVIHQKLDVPAVGLLFVPPSTNEKRIIAQLLPQPDVRLAGILYGDRITALIQTADEWKTVKPGDRLRDGTIIQRIERDRIVLKTAEIRPRFVEVKLAASLAPVQPASSSSPSSSGSPSGTYSSSGGGYGGQSM